MSRRILVTGGAGFIGSHLVSKLLAQGDTPVILDNFDPFYPERIKRRAIGPLLAQGVRLIECDLRDDRGMRKAFADAKPEIVVHLAARAGVRPSLEDPGGYMDTNVRGTAHALESARLAGTRRFVLGSSSSVYGAFAKPPFREDARIDSPQSPYAASKVASEVIARTYHNLYGLEIASLRFFTVYGPRQRPDLAIHKFARRMLAGQSIPFFGEGDTRRDYTYIDDIIAGVTAATSVPLQHEIVNLGGSATTTLKELVELLEQNLGMQAKLDRQPLQPGDVPLTNADVAYAKKLLGYEPKTPIRQGIAKFCEWIRGEGQDWV
ncbi:MAG: GDP-mannose 4,6-dehydratase [Deltaproteobacteria bacterium]|nr:GDP-mannose 4,6-dehydratase [Deltaproteobacteria bacterium]